MRKPFRSHSSRFRSAIALTGAIMAFAAACANADAANSNSASASASTAATHGAIAAKADTAVFAGGCFWGVEAVFRHVRGVSSAVSGYAGGDVANPSYERVSDGNTGHAEAVQVVYDPAVVSFATLLEVFFSVAHDPTELNRQGPDVGTQYRSAIFTRNAEQEKAVSAFVAALTAARTFAEPIVTQVAPLSKFWKAEAYHQNYLASHLTQPYIVFNDLPKLDALKREFPELYRENGIASK
jgi:peptide-methionine (S)-S-oxide reductase